CKNSPNWTKWKDAINSEISSLIERNVFGPILECPTDATIIGTRWVFTKKRNSKGIITRYKARFVARGYTQRYGIDYEKTYAPVIDATTLRFLISFATQNNYKMIQADIVTAYLYGNIDK